MYVVYRICSITGSEVVGWIMEGEGCEMGARERELGGGEWKSSERKLVVFFQQSRDQWKAKHQALKALRKKDQNQVRAVEKSREQWRLKAEESQAECRRLTAELAVFKKKSER